MSRQSQACAVSDPYGALNDLPLNLTREVASQIAGVHTRTLDRAIAAGELRTAKLGKRRLVPREELRRWLLAGLAAG